MKRAQLPALLERFRQAGADAEPVAIGARRRPEAVVLSYERHLKLAGGRERVAAALEQQARETTETLDADQAMKLANSELHAASGVRPSADDGGWAPVSIPTCSWRPRDLAGRPTASDRHRLPVRIIIRRVMPTPPPDHQQPYGIPADTSG